MNCDCFRTYGTPRERSRHERLPAKFVETNSKYNKPGKCLETVYDRDGYYTIERDAMRYLCVEKRGVAFRTKPNMAYRVGEIDERWLDEYGVEKNDVVVAFEVKKNEKGEEWIRVQTLRGLRCKFWLPVRNYAGNQKVLLCRILKTEPTNEEDWKPCQDCHRLAKWGPDQDKRYIGKSKEFINGHSHRFGKCNATCFKRCRCTRRTIYVRRLFEIDVVLNHAVIVAGVFILLLICVYIAVQLYQAIGFAKLRNRRRGLLPCYDDEFNNDVYVAVSL